MGGKFWTFHNWRFLALGFPWFPQNVAHQWPRFLFPSSRTAGAYRSGGGPGMPRVSWAVPQIRPWLGEIPHFGKPPDPSCLSCNFCVFFLGVVHVILWLCKKCADTWILPNGMKIHNMTHGPTGRQRSIDDKQFKATFARYLQGSYPHPKREIVSMLL